MRSIPPVPDPWVAHDPHCGIQLSKVLFSSTGLSPAWHIWVVNAGTRVSPNSLEKDSSLIGVVWHWGGDSCPVFQAPGLCCGVEMTVDNEASEEKKQTDTGLTRVPEATPKPSFHPGLPLNIIRPLEWTSFYIYTYVKWQMAPCLGRLAVTQNCSNVDTAFLSWHTASQRFGTRELLQLSHL